MDDDAGLDCDRVNERAALVASRWRTGGELGSSAGMAERKIDSAVSQVESCLQCLGLVRSRCGQ
jgi:hypothetical protein